MRADRQPCDRVHPGSLETGVVDVMSPCDYRVLRHHYPQPRPSHISTVTDPLPDNTVREPSTRASTGKANPSIHEPVALLPTSNEAFNTSIADTITRTHRSSNLICQRGRLGQEPKAWSQTSPIQSYFFHGQLQRTKRPRLP